MATVHFGRLRGPAGFSRTVAVKRLRAHLAEDATFVSMLLDEGRLSARIQSPFVVQTLDIVVDGGELAIIMEYVHGLPLAELWANASRAGHAVEPAIATTIVAQVLHGLHAAHEVVDDHGSPLHLVHRDVSPKNILVGADGIVRVLDFGIAKALGRAQTTRAGDLRGTLAYMAPEHLLGEGVDRRTDVFAASIILWELLTGARLFAKTDQRETAGAILRGAIEPPSLRVKGLDPALDAIVCKGLAREPSARFLTAGAMACALEAWRPIAPASQVAAWVEMLGGEVLAELRARQVQVERGLPPAPDPVLSATADMTMSAQVRSVTPIAGAPTPSAASGPKRRMPWATIGVAAGLAAAAVLALELHRAPHAVEAAGSPPAAVSSASSAPSVTPEAIAAPAPNASAVAAAPAASHPMPAAEGQLRRSVGRSAAPGPSRAVARSPVDCTDPYVFDANGRRRYRRECLTP
jgi:serine/threonine-protein kinase